jgi:hypothetical protein
VQNVTDTPKAQIVHPPNLLKSKVSGSGPISQEMLNRAETALDGLAAQFDALMDGEIKKLGELHHLGVREEARRADLAKHIFEIAHDLRGQAGTFDYPLITRVGSSLCHFTDGLTYCDEQALTVIRLHIDAMQAIVASSLRGDGGDVGQAIASGLEKAVGKVLA